MPQAPSNGREQRRLTLDDVRVRTARDGEEIRVRGHAAVWDKPAWIGPPRLGFSERFESGAFKESINGGADVRYLFNHNPDAVLARTKSGTLSLGEDRTGLTVEADLAPTSVGRDLAILLERGDVNQMSVGMQVLEDVWDEVEGKDGNLYERRTIKRAKLFDVSAVTYPAYEDTDAGLRQAEVARELRDARGVHVERKHREPEPITPPDPPRTARVEVLPDGDLRIHRPDGTTTDLTGAILGRSVAFDGSNVSIPAGTYTTNVGTPNITVDSSGVHVNTTRAVSTHPEGQDPTERDPSDTTQTPTTAPPPEGGELTTPNPAESGVPSSSGPPTGTPKGPETRALSDSERPLLDLLREHAFTDEHRRTPRLVCPACNRPPTGTA